MSLHKYPQWQINSDKRQVTAMIFTQNINAKLLHIFVLGDLKMHETIIVSGQLVTNLTINGLQIIYQSKW